MAGSRKEYELLFKLKAALGGNFNGTFQTAISSTKQLQDSLTKINSIQSKTEGFKKQSLAFENNKNKLEQLNEEHRRLSAEMESTEAPSAELRKSFEKNERQIHQTTLKMEEQERNLGKLGQELRNSGINTDNLEQANKRLSKSYEIVKKSQEDIAKINSAKQANSASIAETKGKIVGTVGAVTALGVALYAGPVKSAMQFESNMAETAKVVDWLKDGTGAVTKEYGLLKKEVLDITTKIPMTAEEITNIMAAAGQANVAKNNDELVKFTEYAAKMGIAFDSTSEQAGEWMAKWRTSFKMNQEEVVTLADKINYLGNTSAANAQQISSIVTKIGPLGEIAGFASGEVAALGATLVAVGVNEDVAATGIKKVMTTMTSGSAATKGQTRVLDQLGLSATNLAERMQTDAKGAILDFLEAVKQLPQAEQAAALKTYFGEESVAAIAPLLTNLDYLSEQFEKVGDSSKYAGSMEAEYASRAATTENKVQLAKNSLSKLAITLGDVFLPSIGQAAEKISELLIKLSDFTAANPELVKTISGVVGGFIAFRVASLSLKFGFLQIKQGILDVQGIFALFKGNAAKVGVESMGLSSKLRTVGGGIKTYFSGLGSAFGTFMSSSSIGSKIATVSTSIGSKLSGGILNALSLVGGKFGSVFSGLGKIIAGPFLKIGSLMAGPLGKLGVFFAPLGNLLSTAFAPIMKLLPMLGSGFGGVLGKIFPIIMVISLVVAAVQILKDHLDEVRAFIGKVFGDAGLQVFDTIVAAISNIGSVIQNIFSEGNLGGARDFIQNIFGEQGVAVFNGLITIFSTVFSVIQQFVAFVDANVKPVLENLFNFIIQTILPMLIQSFSEFAPIIASIIQNLWTVISGILTVVMSVVSAVMPTIQSIITTVVSAISGVISGLLKVIQGILDFVIGVFTGNWQQAWEGVGKIFSGVFEGLKSIAKGAIDVVIDLVNLGIRQLNKLKLPDFLGGGGINIPEIPGFATGTNKTPGTFIAGENGPELITNAPGRKVYTADQTKNIFNNVREGNTNNENTSIRNIIDIAPQLKDLFESIRATIVGALESIQLPQLQQVYSLNANTAAIAIPTVTATSTSGNTTIKIYNQPQIQIDGEKPADLDEKLRKNNENLLDKVDEMLRKKDDDDRRSRYD